MIFNFIYFCVRGQRGPKKRNLFLNNCVLILTCLNFSHPPSSLHLMQYTYRDIFSSAQNSFWTHWFWYLLVLLAFFFYLFHIGKMFPFEDFFHRRGGQKKVTQSEIRWIGQVGHRGPAVFCSKTARHSERSGLECS